MEDEKELKKGQKAYLQSLVNNFLKEAKNALESIERLKEDLIKGQEGTPSLLEQFRETESEIKQIKEKINLIYSSIYEPNESNEVLADDIENFREDFEEKRKEIDIIFQQILNYQTSLLGTKNEDGTSTKGIKDNIEGYVKKFDELYNLNMNRQDELFKKIESLLRGASTVALAESFNKHKESFNGANWGWITVFILSIASMMCLSVWGFLDSNGNIDLLWKHTVGNLPFLVGAIWLAVFAGKQRSQNIRLQQEYAFKEDVAKVYYGLKQEIEELGETELGTILNEKILTIILETVSYNPSHTLESRSHNDKGPMLETLNNIAGTIKDLKIQK